jgi:light-regulated signal transduction histidine kinase (bacteriophytochrome)
MNLITALLSISCITVLAILLLFQMRIVHLQKEKQTARDILDRQIQLTDAYAWEVESKRFELMQALTELRKAHENTVLVNRNLEEEVCRRTKALTDQNQKIIEYHFINAHKLRAPVARIMGLASLLQKGGVAENNMLVIQHLANAVQELDDTVHAIQQTLYAAEYNERMKSA